MRSALQEPAPLAVDEHFPILVAAVPHHAFVQERVVDAPDGDRPIFPMFCDDSRDGVEERLLRCADRLALADGGIGDEAFHMGGRHRRHSYRK